jgi:hypothetical protein
MNPLEAASRFVPTLSWLRYILPDRFQHPMETAAVNLSSVSSQNQHRALKSYSIARTGPANAQVNSQVMSFAPVTGSTDSVEVRAVAGSAEAGSVDYSAAAGSRGSRVLLPFQMDVLSSALMDHSIGQHICILGPKV